MENGINLPEHYGMIKKKCPNPYNYSKCEEEFFVYPQNSKLKKLCNACQRRKKNIYNSNYTKQWVKDHNWIRPSRRK